jgi:phosphoglycerol transferase MdoB-like AlkP superfamily enzyme
LLEKLKAYLPTLFLLADKTKKYFSDKEKSKPFGERKPLRVTLSTGVSLIIIFVLSAATTAMVLFKLQYAYKEDVGIWYYMQPHFHLNVFIMNFLPVVFVMLFLFFATGRLAVAFPATAFLFGFFAVANRFKVFLRDDPLYPWDLSSAREALSVLSNNSAGIIGKVALFTLFFIALTAALCFFVRNRVSAASRAAGAVIAAVALTALNLTLYRNPDIYESVSAPVYDYVAEYNLKGFIYAFIYKFNEKNGKTTNEPRGYTAAAIEEAQARHAPVFNGEAVRPHVIFVMGEAFTDVSELPIFDFTGFADPLENFKKIREQSVSGRLLVSGTGGGTADTEFDVLTGMSKREEPDVQYAFKLISKPTGSLAGAFKSMGYVTAFLHPGDGWFYHRSVTYKQLGFENVEFKPYFNDENGKGEYKGGWMTEKTTIDGLIRNFEHLRANNQGKPVFEYLTTIQNHGPYNEKYGAWGKDFFRNFNTRTEMPDDDVMLLSNYFEGVKDADRELARLTDYLNGLGEPAALVYFGDHMPSWPWGLYTDTGIGDEELSAVISSADFNKDEIVGRVRYEIGDALNAASVSAGQASFESRIAIYQTPYIIWQNDAYRKIEDFNALYPDGKLISDSFLGAEVMEMIGQRDVTSFISFLNGLRKLVPVAAKHEYITSGGEYKTVDDLSPEEAESVTLYKYWQYYNLYSSKNDDPSGLNK